MRPPKAIDTNQSTRGHRENSNPIRGFHSYYSGNTLRAEGGDGMPGRNDLSAKAAASRDGNLGFLPDPDKRETRRSPPPCILQFALTKKARKQIGFKFRDS